MMGMRQGQKQNTVAGPLPASNAGINAVDSLAEMAPNECIYTYNLIAQDYGMEVRPGYAEWANGWTGTAKTVITFEGATTAQDKLWVADENGIWDCTTADTTAPTQKIVFPSTSGNAGICSYITYSTDGSAQFVLLCDGENGYYVWTQSTNTWAKIALGAGAGQILGVDPSNFVFVMAWKERVWFIEKNTSKAWYLAVNTIYGTVASFVFGGQFMQGGNLRTLHNWTLDGGIGVDDYLVGVSGAGDVSIYQGTDPASASAFGMVGTWNIGKVPAGNRIGRNFGGELFILSSYGLLPCSSLLKGADTREIETYASRKITPYLRATFDAVIDDFGWHIPVHPKKSLLYINAPKPLSSDQISYCMYFGNGAWSMVRGLAKNHSAEWQGGVYWCDDGKLYKELGNVDKVYINTAADGVAEAIEWDCLTSFQPIGEPSRFKRVQYIRPNFVAESSPSYDAFARYDYNITEATTAPVVTSGDTGVFGTGLWGTALWAGGLSASSRARGATGSGRMVAVVLRGASSSPTSLVAYDVYVDYGGLM
tara:strand:+ start:2102 stop:3712 length:1611 start_codon:yes stop_codon:yes gene_type:complete